jgi:hypothetical protein
VKRVSIVVLALLALSALFSGVVYSCADISPCHTDSVVILK